MKGGEADDLYSCKVSHMQYEETDIALSKRGKLQNLRTPLKLMLWQCAT